MSKFRVTYQVVTEESAQQGDFAEHGYALPGGWRIPLNAISNVDDNGVGVTLREAIGISTFPEDSGRWFSSVDPDTNYSTGDETFYSLHPPEGITQSSYNRLKRFLTGR